MPDWRRVFVPGATYFFTVVTDQRQPIFADLKPSTILGNVFRECSERWPFEMPAVVLLPDHLHTIWTLPRDDAAFPRRWAWIKKEFTKRWLSQGGTETHVTEGRRRDGRRGVWQPKYWEHVIRDEHDFERHFDYIHFNPVKHNLSRCPHEWKRSSFHRWLKKGVYPANWGCGIDAQRLRFKDIETSVGE